MNKLLSPYFMRIWSTFSFDTPQSWIFIIFKLFLKGRLFEIASRRNSNQLSFSAQFPQSALPHPLISRYWILDSYSCIPNSKLQSRGINELRMLKFTTFLAETTRLVKSPPEKERWLTPKFSAVLTAVVFNTWMYLFDSTLLLESQLK